MTKEDEAALFARVEAMLKRIDMLDISKDLRSLLALAQANTSGGDLDAIAEIIRGAMPGHHDEDQDVAIMRAARLLAPSPPSPSPWPSEDGK